MGAHSEARFWKPNAVELPSFGGYCRVSCFRCLGPSPGGSCRQIPRLVVGIGGDIGGTPTLQGFESSIGASSGFMTGIQRK
jgi:hypothetical protein